MPSASRKQLAYETAEVLGVYGQNGSGKEEEIADYIDANGNQAEITADFNILAESVAYEASYKIILQKSENGAKIIQETLSCAINKEGSRSNKTVFMDYQRSNRETVFAPKKRLDEVVEANTENKTNLIVAKKMAEKSNCSYIFGESSREIFCRDYDNNFKHYHFYFECFDTGIWKFINLSCD